MRYCFTKRTAPKLQIFILLLFAGISSFAQTTSWTGAVDQHWNKAGNWTNGVPNANTDAIIGDANYGTRLCEVKIPSVCKSLTIGGVKAATVKTRNQLTVMNNITVNSNGTLDHDKTTTLYGNFINNGIFIDKGGSKVTFSAPSATISGTTITDFDKITVSAGTTLTFLVDFNADATVNGNLIPGSATVKMTSGSGGKVTVNNAGYMQVLSTLYTGNYACGITLKGGSIVEYAALGNQTIAKEKYSTLILSGSGTKNPTQDMDDMYNNQAGWGNVYVMPGVIFDLLTYDLKRSGGGAAGGVFSVANGATFRMGGTVSFPINYLNVTLGASSTVEYYGNNQTVRAHTYGHLIFSGTSGTVTKTMPTTAFTVVGNFTTFFRTASSVTFSPGNNITFMGNVTLGILTTFSGSSRLYTVYGNWVNNGTYTPVTSTVNFAGTSKTISGSGSHSFFNVIVSGTDISTTVNSLVVSGNFATTGVGTFSQTAGTLTMSGAARTISGSNINLNHYTVSGSVTSTAIFSVAGNFTTNAAASFNATSGSTTMTGTARTITNNSTLNFYTLAVTGTITTASNFNVSFLLSVSGSLTASAGTVTFTSTSVFSGTANLFNVTINGTSLQLSTNCVLGIAGVYTVTAGFLNVTSTTPNTVHFNSTTPRSLAGSTFHHVIFSNSAYTATGGFTSNGSFTINPAATFIAGTFTHTIRRDFTNNGTFTRNTSTVQFTGTSDANIFGATTFNILTLNKSANTNLLNLQSNVTASTVNMTTGKMLTGTNTLTITTTRTGNGIILGNILRTHAFTTGVAYAFEGPDNTITFSSVSGVASVLVKVTSAPVTGFPWGASMNRLYDVSIAAGTYNATLRLHYEDHELNGNTESTLAIWQNVASTWTNVGKTGNNTTSNYVELSGLTNISTPWTLSENITVISWNGSVSTDWATPANWTVVQGAPSAPPSVNDIALIGYQAYTFAPIITSAAVAKSIQFGPAVAATLSLSAGGTLAVSGNISGTWTSNLTHIINVNSRTLTVGGDMVLSDGTANRRINLSSTNGSMTISGSLIQSGNANVNITGTANLRIGRDYDYSGGTFSRGNGTVTYNGSVNQLVAPLNYNNLTINSSAIARLNNSAVVSGNLTVTAGQLDVNATLSVAGNVAIAAAGVLDGAGVNINVGGNWSNSGSFVPSGGTVTLDGTLAQTVSATTFNNFVVNKTGGAAIVGNINTTGDLTVLAGDLNLNIYTANRTVYGGAFSMSAGTNLYVSGANNFPANYATYNLSPASTVVYNGTMAQTVAGVTYGNIIFSNGGSNAKTIVNNTVINGDVTINTGATFNADIFNIDLYGNWITDGSFVPTNSTVALLGIGKTITGTTSFFNLDVYGSYSAGSLAVTGLLATITGGSLTTSGDITLSGDLQHTGSLSCGGTFIVTGTILQNLNVVEPVLTNINVITFNGSVSPSISSTDPLTFNTVNVNNTAGVNANTDINVNTAFNINAGASFVGGPYIQTVYGSFTNNGDFSSSGSLIFLPTSAQTLIIRGNSFNSTGSVQFGGSAAINVSGTPNSLQDVLISNSVGVTPSSDWSLAGNFVIDGDGVFNAGNYNYTIAGDFQSDGTLNGGTSTFTMTSLLGNLSGSSNTTFYNLVISGIITVLSDFNVSKDFTNNGTFDNIAAYMHMVGNLPSSISAPATFTLAQLSIEKNSGIAATLTRGITGVVGLDVTSGIFNQSTFTITESSGMGLLTISEGATMQIGGTNTLPTFTSYDLDSLSTVEYNGATQSVSAATAYGNLTISSLGTKTAANALTIRNDFTLYNGTFTGGNYNHDIGGHWTMSSGGFLTTSNTITFNGGGDQIITSTGAFNNLRTNKPAGSITLASDITVNGTLTFLSGIIATTSSYEVIINTNGAVSGAGQSTGWVFGRMRRIFSSTILSRGFNVGTASNYNPVTVTFASVTGTGGGITVRAFGNTHPNLTASPLPWNKNIPAFWRISNSGGVNFTTFNLNTGWNSAQNYTGISVPKLRVGKYASATWSNETLLGTSTTTTCSASGITTVGDFVVGEPCVIAGFEYDTYYYCTSAGTVSPTMYPGASSGTWTATPSGLSIDVSNGNINTGASIAGVYIIKNTTTGPGGCTIDVSDTIEITAAPSATISYTGSPYCSNSMNATVTLTGSTGGIYTSTAGLVIDSVSGTVDISASAAGTYTVTYTVAAYNGCAEFSTTTSITINTLPTASITYGAVNFCSSSGTASVTLTGTTGGVYSAAAGLSLNASTGEVNLGASTPGTYAIYYTIAAAGGCAQVQASTLMVIRAQPAATISYGGSPYCSSAGTAAVTHTGTAGGSYSSTAGLSINASTGEINLIASTAGTYTVTYTVAAGGGCSVYTATASVTVTAQPSATISYPGTPYCNTGIATVTLTGTAGGAFTSAAGLSINSASGSVDLAASTPGAYTITYTVAPAGGCAQYQVSTSISINDQGVWLGTVNTNWNEAANWQCGIVPTSTSNIQLASGLTNYPVLSSGSTEVNNITLAAGSSITVSGATLAYKGTISSTGGTINATGGTIELSGTAAQILPANIFTSNTIEGVKISNSSGVTLNGTLEVSGVVSFGNVNNATFNTNDSLTISSTNTTTGCVGDLSNGNVNSGNSIVGKVTVERYITAHRAYRFITAPVTTDGDIRENWMENSNNVWQSVNINPYPGYGTHITGTGGYLNDFDQTATNNPSMFTYNNLTQTWSAVTNIHTNFAPGMPYRLMVRGDRSTDLMTNNPTPSPTTLRATGYLLTGDVFMTKTGGGGTPGIPVLTPTIGHFNYIANPYAACVDWHMLEKGDLANTIYVFDPTIEGANSRGGYVTYNGTLGTNNVVESEVDNYIQSGQSFFVETIGANPMVTFKEPHKSTAHRNVFRGVATLPQIKLQLLLPGQDTSGKSADGLGVYFSNDFENTIGNEDSYKFINQDENIGVMRDAKVLSLEGRKPVVQNDTINLKVWQLNQPSYKFKVTVKNFAANIQAFLEDNYLQTLTPVINDDVTLVPFTITTDAASKAQDRFRIVFKPASTLPVEFTNIKAYQKDKGIQVDWAVVSEKNIDRHEVEKSADARSFDKAGMVKVNNNGVEVSDYNWFDASPFNGDNYYRIKSIDISGAVKYSKIVKVNTGKSVTGINVVPNPVQGGTINLVIDNLDKGSYMVTLMNNSGQKVYSGYINHKGGSGTETIRLKDKMPNGIYQLQLHKGEKPMQISVFIQ